MRKTIGELLNVNITELSIAGLLLLGTSLGIGLGVTMAVGLGMDVSDQAYYQRPIKRVALVGWLAAAAIYFGGQWALRAVGVSVDRKKTSLSRRSMADWAITRGVIGFSAFGLAGVLAYATADAVLVVREADPALQNPAMEAGRLAQPESIRAAPEDSRPHPCPLPVPSVAQDSASSSNLSLSAAGPPAGTGRSESTSSQFERIRNEQEEIRRAVQKAAEDQMRRAQERWLALEARRKPTPPAVASPEGFRTWHDSTGKSMMEGKVVSNTDGKVTIEKIDGHQVVIPVERFSEADQTFLNSIGRAKSKPSAEAVAGRDTEQVGGTGGWEFRNEGSGPLLGFRYHLAQWDNERCLASLEPIFDPNAPFAGQSAVIARTGYAVGALNVEAKRFVNAVQIVFMRLKPDGRLDPSDRYTSPWIGFPSGKPRKTISGNGTPVVGIFGREGAVLDAIGLILRGE